MYIYIYYILYYIYIPYPYLIYIIYIYNTLIQWCIDRIHIYIYIFDL